MPATNFFTVLFSIVVLIGTICFIVKFLPLPPRYDAVKKALVLAVNVLVPSALYFGALHLQPDMGTPRFAAYTAVYLGCILIRSWQVVKVSR